MSERITAEEIARNWKEYGHTASMIVAEVCNEHKDSDLLARDAPILRRFNTEFDAYQLRIEALHRELVELGEKYDEERAGRLREQLKVATLMSDLAESDRARTGLMSLILAMKPFLTPDGLRLMKEALGAKK